MTDSTVVALDTPKLKMATIWLKETITQREPEPDPIDESKPQ
jgi:hypothetical protein